VLFTISQEEYWVVFNGMLPAGVGQVIKGWDVGVNGI